MLEWLTKIGEEVRQNLISQVSRFKNREFMEATVAACALVALADGTISPEEKRKMHGFMQASDELNVFSTDEVIAFFNRVVAKFDFDFEIGRMEAIKVIKKLQHNQDACRVMVRVCCVIGASDGNFDDDEKKIVSGICKELGIDPKEFGL